MAARPREGTPLGQAIRERREFLALSQAQVAVQVGTSQKIIWELERDEGSNPTYRRLCEIAEALGTTVAALDLRAREIKSERTSAERT